MSLNIDVDHLTGVPKREFLGGKGNYTMVIAHETAVNNDSIARNKRVFGSYGWKNMSAFVQYFVDHTGIWEASSPEFRAWGAGGKVNPYAVHVELCRRSDTDEFNQSYAYYVELLAYLLNKRNLTFKRLDTFYTHHDVSKHLGGTSHVDPDAYLKSHGVSISDLVNDIKKAIKSEGGKVSVSKSSKNTTSKTTPTGGDPTVRKIQNRLNNYHGISIVVDGLKGPESKKALVNAYQQELRVQFGAKITADGLPGPKTDASAINIRYNKTKGDLAFLVQAMLYFHGIKVGVDGFFQDGSISGVKQFQRKHGLTPDGIAGRSTFKKLIRM